MKPILLAVAIAVVFAGCSVNGEPASNEPTTETSVSSTAVGVENDIAVSNGTLEETQGVQAEIQTTEQQETEDTTAAEPQTTEQQEEQTSSLFDKYNLVLTRSDERFSEAGIYELANNVIYELDFNGDGVSEEFALVDTTQEYTMVRNGELETCTGDKDLYLTINGAVYADTGIRYGSYAYLLKKENGSIGLAVCGELPGYHFLFYLYRMDGAEPVLMFDEMLQLSQLTMDSFFLSGTISFLGTRPACIGCTLNEDFSVTYQNDGFYDLGHRPLTTKVDLSVEMLENGEYIEKTLPAGSTIYLTGTNKTGCCLFELDDGSAGRFYFEVRGFSSYIDGKQEEDVFNGIVYAGG